jgi:hypothetical protein
MKKTKARQEKTRQDKTGQDTPVAEEFSNKAPGACYAGVRGYVEDEGLVSELGLGLGLDEGDQYNCRVHPLSMYFQGNYIAKWNGER